MNVHRINVQDSRFCHSFPFVLFSFRYSLFYSTKILRAIPTDQLIKIWVTKIRILNSNSIFGSICVTLWSSTFPSVISPTHFILQPHLPFTTFHLSLINFIFLSFMVRKNRSIDSYKRNSNPKLREIGFFLFIFFFWDQELIGKTEEDKCYHNG